MKEIMYDYCIIFCLFSIYAMFMEKFMFVKFLAMTVQLQAVKLTAKRPNWKLFLTVWCSFDAHKTVS